MRVSLIQMNSRNDRDANRNSMERLIREAVEASHPDLVITPEYSNFLGGSTEDIFAAAEDSSDSATLKCMSALSKELGVGIHVGSILERAGEHCKNTAVIFGRDGEEIARYSKIHMFDIESPSGTVFRESDTISRGCEPIVYEFDGHKIGASICFDLRFPELFRKLTDMGAEAIALPAAFTFETGSAHWDVLCRARAIETQCYFMAAAQTGSAPFPKGELACFGNSMVVDPWGVVIASVSGKVGWCTAELDFDYVTTVRGKVPMAANRAPELNQELS
jgi:predicted amidohydrolase